MGSAKKKRAQVSSDREKCQVIFNALKLMLRKQQTQLDSLVDERNLLEQRFKILYDRWICDVRESEDQISQMQRQISLAELSKLVETAKGDLLVGLKRRDALAFKLKLEHAESELHDFKAWFDILSHRCPNQEDISPNKLYENLKAKGRRGSSSKEGSISHLKELEKEVVMLKREYDKLSVKNSSDVSSLQAEINFVWNQYKEMESNYSNQLQNKNTEINQANEKVMKLLAGMEQLQTSSAEKDETVATLRASISKLEDEANQKDGEISKLKKEVELLSDESGAGLPVLRRCSSKPSSSNSTCTRKGRSRVCTASEEETLRAKISGLEAEANLKNGEISKLSKDLQLLKPKSAADTHTPIIRHCSGEPSLSRSRSKGTGRNKGSAASSAELLNEQGSRRSKRKQEDETPKLFTSQFKIPKLKSQSPRGR